MSRSILVDVNLSPEWAGWLADRGWSAEHWSTAGDPAADDATIMAWARENGSTVLTHDLDFGTALALTHAGAPSVIQVRGRRVLPEQIGNLVLAALNAYQVELAAGALVVVEPIKSRVRVLPL